MDVQRREFLKFMGQSSIGLAIAPALLYQLGCTSKGLKIPGLPFKPIRSSTSDDLILSDGFTYKILISDGDSIHNNVNFGAHCDFNAFLPIVNKDEGILMVNHEYLHTALLHNRKIEGPRSKEDIIKEQGVVGVSLLHIKNQQGQWSVVKNSKFNRRISGRTPIPFQKGFKIHGSTKALGTISNCAGGVTPWNTFLSCEENYDIFYGEVDYQNKKRSFIERPEEFEWYTHFPLPPEHYGWVVEIEPKTGKAVKRNALGRFAHEGATVVMSKNHKVVVYMGEDVEGGFIYKFISDSPGSLEKGTLYAADTIQGQWLPLDIKKNKKLQQHFNNQQDVLTYAHQAAVIVGATPQDRPEDIEVHPHTNDLFVALTKNTQKKDMFGSLLKIEETNKDFGSLTFKSSTWKKGSIENGFACPDNMAFDQKGNLWLTVDMSENHIRKGHYKGLGNNGLFYLPLSGPLAGEVFQVASAPRDAEFTGPWFSPDQKTLFLSIQHPGDGTVDPKKPTSTWPDRANGVPKSSVVTISGPALEALTQ